MHWIQQLETDLDNIRIALERSRQNAPAIETGLKLSNALGWFWSMSERELEGIRWLNQLLALSDEHIVTDIRAWAHFFVGFLQWFLADYPAAMPHLEQSIALWQNSNNTLGLAYASIIQTHIHSINGRLTHLECMEAIETSAAVFRQIGDDWGLSLALGRAGSTALAEKDYARAMRYYEEAYAARRRSGLSRMWAGALGNLGFTAMCQGDFDRAIQYLEQAVIFGEAYNSIAALMTAQCNLGHIQCLRGNAAGALRTFVGCLAHYRDRGARDHIIATLAGIAYATTGVGATLRAAILLDAVQHQIEAYNINLWDIERESFDTALAAVQHTLNARNIAEAWALGQSMTLAQTIEFALASA